MKITKVVAIDPATNERQVFTFATSAEGKGVVTTRGGRLNNYVEFCFKQGVECSRDVELEFCINEDLYSMSRVHAEDGSTRTVLKKLIDGHYQVVARNHAVQYIEQIIDEQMSHILKLDYVTNKAVDDFHGDLKLFDEIRLLADVQDNILRSSEETKALRDSAMRKVKEYSAEKVAPATTEQLDALNKELDTVVRDLTIATAQLGELKAKQNVDSIRSDITKELESTQSRKVCC